MNGLDFAARGATATGRDGRRPARLTALALACAAALSVAGCQTAALQGEVATIEAEQGSAENIASLTEVIRANPNDARAFNVRGSAFGRGGRYREALEDFDRAIAIDPRFYEAYANRALIHRFLGDQASAAADYSAALRINPNYDKAYIGRGELYRRAGRVDEAFGDFDTTDPRAYHRRGLIYQTRNQHQFAIDDFSTAISLQPDAPEPYNARAISYLALSQLDNAFDDANFAIELDRNNAESWLNQGLVYEARGENERAARSYRRALQIDSDLTIARNALGRVS